MEDDEKVPKQLLDEIKDLQNRINELTGKLHDNEERFRSIAEFAYDVETWRGPDGNYLFISPVCERITGYGSDTFLEDPLLFVKIAHPEDKKLVSAKAFCVNLGICRWVLS